MKGILGVLVCVAVLLAGGSVAGEEPLQVTTILNEPYAMTKGSGLEGYCVDLMSELSKKLGLKHRMRVVKDGRYGSQDASGNWNGVIGEVVRGEADLAVADLTVTASRESAVELSKPFMQTGLSFVMRRDLVAQSSGYGDLLSPFSTHVWVGILVSYLITSLCLYLVTRMSPCEWAGPLEEESTFSLLHSFWYIAGALTLQGAGPHPKALSGRLVSAIWWLFSIVLLATYFSRVSAWLKSDQGHLSIQSFEDLAKQDIIEYGTVDGGSSLAFFKTSQNPVYRSIYAQMERRKSMVSNKEEGIRRVLEGNFAFIGEAVSLDLVVGRYCNLVRCPQVVAMRGYGIAAPLGSPLVKNLSTAILQLSESGELDYLRSKWWPSSCVAPGDQSSPLTPATLKGLFLLLALGLGTGLLIALLELTGKARGKAKAHQKSCCSILSSELSQRFSGNAEKTPEDAPEKCKA
ncbi:probable glutamate receptor isoform X1 [Alosa alosa]|nr:probable glutamate receptor isoform X1 [Alosa sapidissima]XP_048096609.1 probable glutamate receptor isoform X1 [Alosa alosa]XP_048096610.1 probable glutamate receptor isoform X1 [Alosa alosa]